MTKKEFIMKIKLLGFIFEKHPSLPEYDPIYSKYSKDNIEIVINNLDTVYIFDTDELMEKEDSSYTIVLDKILYYMEKRND